MRVAAPWILAAIQCIAVLACPNTACPQDAFALEETLDTWYQQSLRRRDFTATLQVCEFDAKGKWISEVPWPATLSVQKTPHCVRLDCKKPNLHSWLLTKDQTLLATQQPPRKLTDAETDPASLWIGDLPIFLILDPEPERMRYRYQVRAFDSAPGERTIFLYPQRKQERQTIARLEVRLDTKHYQPIHIHVVYVGGRQVFFQIEDMQPGKPEIDGLFEKLDSVPHIAALPVKPNA